MGRAARLTLAGLIGVVCWAPAVQAATVQVIDQRYRSAVGTTESTNRLVITGGGEHNDIVVSSGDATTVSDRAGIRAGAGCISSAGVLPTVTCPAVPESGSDLEPPPFVRAALGPGDDRIALRDSDPGAGLGGVLDGGSGDDRLAGGPGDNVLRGGPGRDLLIGTGDSTLFDEGGPTATGGDTFRVAFTSGTVSYAGRRRPVRVDMRAPDAVGQRGERDRIVGASSAEFFRVLGGRAADRLVGRSRNDTLEGRGGTDLISGLRGDDTLIADGRDRSDPAVGDGRGPDRLSGGPGADRLFGNRGRNRLDGGPGADDLRAGAGRDLVLARDRSPDLVDCGRGADRAALDVRDDIAGLAAVRCEVVARTPPASATVEPGVQVDSGDSVVADQDGGFLNLRCPTDAPRRCRGRVDVVRRGRLLARGRFSINRRGGPVTLRTTSTGRRLLSRAADDTFRVTARVISRDRTGIRRVVSVRGYRMAYTDENQFEGPGND